MLGLPLMFCCSKEVLLWRAHLVLSGTNFACTDKLHNQRLPSLVMECERTVFKSGFISNTEYRGLIRQQDAISSVYTTQPLRHSKRLNLLDYYSPYSPHRSSHRLDRRFARFMYRVITCSILSDWSILEVPCCGTLVIVPFLGIQWRECVIQTWLQNMLQIAPFSE